MMQSDERDTMVKQRSVSPPVAGFSVGLAVALVLAAFNLRPALASIGSLLDDVRGGLGMNATLAGALTSIPSACFAVVGFFVPRLIRRFGPGAVLCGAMLVVALGLLSRALAGGTALFLVCSAVAVAGIGAGNVVMPAAVRAYFPHRIGLLTGLYSMALTAGAALAAAVAVPIADAFGGWRAGIGVWALPALLAALVWLAVLVRRRTTDRQPPAPVAEPAPATASLVRSRTAWSLTVFFGLQAAGAYMVLGWLPQILRDAGVSAGHAGLLLALTPTVGIPFAFVIPTLAARLRSQGGLVAALSGVGLVGYLGLALAPATTPWVWAVLLGISQAAFPLALTMIGLRARSTADAARLSAFAQSIGYLIAIPCPLLVGVLYDHTGGWGAPIAFMAAVLVPQTVAGVLAGRRPEHA